jgi:hypothetical protein
MPASLSTPRRISFGPYEADLQVGELRKQGPVAVAAVPVARLALGATGPARHPPIRRRLSRLCLGHVSAVSEANGRAVPVGLDFRVRFRYSRLKEAALFAAGAMGFQSISVWKLLISKMLAGRPSNRDSSNLTIKLRLTITSS